MNKSNERTFIEILKEVDIDLHKEDIKEPLLKEISVKSLLDDIEKDFKALESNEQTLLESKLDLYWGDLRAENSRIAKMKAVDNVQLLQLQISGKIFKVDSSRLEVRTDLKNIWSIVTAIPDLEFATAAALVYIAMKLITVIEGVELEVFKYIKEKSDKGNSVFQMDDITRELKKSETDIIKAIESLLSKKAICKKDGESVSYKISEGYFTSLLNKMFKKSK